MADELPLRLGVEPGEYRCVWKLRDRDGTFRDFSGDLSIEADGPPIGSIDEGDLPIEWQVQANGERSAGFPQSVSYPFLVGRLLNGHGVVLTDATVDMWMTDRASIHARAAVVGGGLTEFDAEPKYASIKVQITGLDAIAGVAPLKSFTFPRAGDPHLKGTWSVDGNPDSSQEWSKDGVIVRLEYDGSARIGDPYSYRLAFSPVAVVVSNLSLSLDEWVQRWAEVLRRIVSLLTGRAEQISYLAVGRPKVEQDPFHRYGQVFGSALKQAPYESRRDELFRMKPAVRLKTDGVSLFDLVDEWQKLAAAHHPLLETYGSFLALPSQHPRARYLLLVQALEGLHGYETRTKFDGLVARHKTQRAEMLDSVALSYLNSADAKFLKKHLAKRPWTSLDDSLRGLISTLPVDLTPRIEETAIIQEMASDSRPGTEVVSRLRLIRNDLAHGTRGYDTGKLHEVTILLDRVVRAHALRVLGLNSSIQRRVLEDDQRKA